MKQKNSCGRAYRRACTEPQHDAEVWRRFKKNKGAVVGLCIFLVICVLAISAGFVYDYDTQVVGGDVTQRLQSPSWEHPFGTDEMGRDILIRVIYGARYSLSVGVVAVAIALVIGVSLGALAGYVGGITENIIMRITDIFYRSPQYPACHRHRLCYGPEHTQPDDRRRHLFFCIVRSDFPCGSSDGPQQRICGSSTCHRLEQLSHCLLPHSAELLAPIIVQATLRVGASIISASSLSFLGIGVPLPAPEWGAMLSGGRAYIRDYSYMTLFPGLAIMLTVVSLNLVGDALRDAIDPKLKK